MGNPIHLADDNALLIVIESHSQLPLNLYQSVATVYLTRTRYDVAYPACAMCHQYVHY